MVVNKTEQTPHVGIRLQSIVFLPISSPTPCNASPKWKDLKNISVLTAASQYCEPISNQCKVQNLGRERLLFFFFLVICYYSHFTFTSFKYQKLLNVRSVINGNLAKYWHSNSSFPKEYKITIISYQFNSSFTFHLHPQTF